jgi:hypothetical protein
MKTRKSVISNYIPHKTPKRINYKNWTDEYFKNLVDMFELVRHTINMRHPKNNINSNEVFNVFCRMIFNSSSKHIQKY